MTNYYSDQMEISRVYGWHVYIISVPGFSKIGSASRVAIRLTQIQSGNPHPLQLEEVWHFKCRNEARAVEALALSKILDRLPKRDWCRCLPQIAIAAVLAAIYERNSAAVRLLEAA